MRNAGRRARARVRSRAERARNSRGSAREKARAAARARRGGGGNTGARAHVARKPRRGARAIAAVRLSTNAARAAFARRKARRDAARATSVRVAHRWRAAPAGRPRRAARRGPARPRELASRDTACAHTRASMHQHVADSTRVPDQPARAVHSTEGRRTRRPAA